MKASLLMILILTTGFADPVLAASGRAACFEQEVDPSTRKLFQQEAYEKALQEWKRAAPTSPGLFALAKAYTVYRGESLQTQKIKNDKRAHCYLGCRISQETSYRVAEYVGWLKEDRDLKDCQLKTHFDRADFEATLTGAHLGQSQEDALSCLQMCQQNY